VQNRDDADRVREVSAQAQGRPDPGAARVENPFVEAVVPGGAGHDDRLVFLGDDATGRALEVMAVRTETGLLVIHVMDLRPKWRPLYEEGRP
jgi:hypothetical protein